MKSEKKITGGLNFNFKTVNSETRDSLVNQMLKRLTPSTNSLCTECNKKKKKCKCNRNSDQELSTQELLRRQQALWVQKFDDDSDDDYRR